MNAKYGLWEIRVLKGLKSLSSLKESLIIKSLHKYILSSPFNNFMLECAPTIVGAVIIMDINVGNWKILYTL